VYKNYQQLFHRPNSEYRVKFIPTNLISLCPSRYNRHYGKLPWTGQPAQLHLQRHKEMHTHATSF